MTIAEEMAADPKYANYFRVVRTMRAEARALREAGGIRLFRKYSERDEFSGREDYDLRKTMEYWK